MLEPDSADLVRHCEQQLVVIEVVGPERQPRFGDHVAVKTDLFWRCGKLGRLVRHDIERHPLAQVPLAKIGPGEDRRIDQCFVVRLGPAPACAALREAIKRGRGGPALWQFDRGLDPDLADVMPGRIEAHLLPLQVEHRRGHGDPPLGGLQRRGVDELGGDLAGAGGERDVEGIGLDRIALPFERLAARLEGHCDQFRQSPARAVGAGQPLREQQRQFGGARRDRDRLGHAVHSARHVGRVDIERQRSAGIGHVHRIGHIAR